MMGSAKVGVGSSIERSETTEPVPRLFTVSAAVPGANDSAAPKSSTGSAEPAAGFNPRRMMIFESAVVIAPPLKIVNGSGSPLRVLALVPG